MATEITQRELRNNSGDIMRRLDRGESFLLTRNGVPVGELTPLRRRRRSVPTEEIIEAFRDLPPIDYRRFRADVDRILDQSPEPRV